MARKGRKNPIKTIQSQDEHVPIATKASLNSPPFLMIQLFSGLTEISVLNSSVMNKGQQTSSQTKSSHPYTVLGIVSSQYVYKTKGRLHLFLFVVALG